MALFYPTAFLVVAAATLSASDGSTYDSSYVFMNVRNSRTSAEMTVCANYQQYLWRELPESVEDATPLRMSWWKKSGDYDICPRRSIAPPSLDGAIVPLEYRLTNQSQKCPYFGPSDTSWRKYFPFQLNRLMDEGASAGLFLLTRGENYFRDYRDFLFSDFRDNTASESLGHNLTMSTFYYYEGDGYFNEVLAMSRDVNGSDLQFRFYRPASYPIDFALLIVFAIAEFCVVVGGLCSASRRYVLWVEEVRRERRRAERRLQKQRQQELAAVQVPTVAVASPDDIDDKGSRSHLASCEQVQSDSGDQEKVSSSTQQGSPPTYEEVFPSGSETPVPNENSPAQPTDPSDPPAAVSTAAAAGGSAPQSAKQHEQSSPPMSALNLLVMVVVVVGMLLLAYYVRSVMMWVFNIMFVLGGTMGLYTCLSGLYDPWGCGQCRVCSMGECATAVSRRDLLPQWYICQATPTWASVVIAFISISISLTWLFTKEHPYSFVLQDILAMCFSIYFIRTLRLPSLKAATILLSLMLVYDLFMVFITPFITTDGCSIMVQVATGTCYKRSPGLVQPVPPVDAPKSDTIPILFSVPKLSDPMLGCYDLSVELKYKPVILGMGDVILPGLLVAYCFGMDRLLRNTFYWYGTVVSVAYALGIVTTFGALQLMNSAQPALIYLVPFTLIATYIAALCRGQFCILWTGEVPKDHEVSPINAGPDEAAQREGPSDTNESHQLNQDAP